MASCSSSDPLRRALLVIAGTASIVCASCVSPLTPDTPRLRTADPDPTVTPVHHRITAASTWWYVTQGDTSWAAKAEIFVVEIDTFATLHAVWLRFRAGADSMRTSNVFQTLEMMQVRLDSLPMDAAKHTLTGDPRTGPGALFALARVIQPGSSVLQRDTCIAGDSKRTAVTVSSTRENTRNAYTILLAASFAQWQYPVTASFHFTY